MENSFSDDIPVGIYRTDDNIKNLKIRVKVRKISNSCFTEKDTFSFGDSHEFELVNLMKAPTASAERTFSWQEKVDKTDKADVSTKDTNHSKKDNVAIQLFTFIDTDILSAAWKNKKSVTSPASQLCPLEEHICRWKPNTRHYLTDIGTWQKPFYNYRKIIKERSKTKGTALPVVQSMAVMADLFFDDSSVNEEIELCFLRVDDHGTLSFVPDFNKRKSYTFINSRSETFEYEVQNVSKVPHRSLIQREKYLMKKIALYKNKLKEGIIGHEIKKPLSGTAFLSFQCEIISAMDFSSSDIFVHYLVASPNGWSTEDSLEGYTGTCRCKVKDDIPTAYYGHIFSIDFTTDLGKINSEPLKIIFEITSVDLWGNLRNEGYGYSYIVLTPGTQVSETCSWKVEPTTLRHRLQNFFIGGMPYLEDLSYIINPKETKDKQLSKYGLQTVSSGKVTFRTYFLQQSN